MYKEGDIVLIKPDLREQGGSTTRVNVTDSMLNYAGKAGRILDVRKKNKGEKILYQLDVDKQNFFWSEDCFVPPSEEQLFDMLVHGTITDEQYTQYVKGRE